MKFRIDNHKLRTETGGCDQIPRVNRLCPACESNQIRDESHFRMYCIIYSILRDNLYRKIENIVPTFKQLSTLQAIGELMTSTNHYVQIIQLAKFISYCFDLRNILLSNQTDYIMIMIIIICS